MYDAYAAGALSGLSRTLGDQILGVVVTSVLTAGATALRWWWAQLLPARRMWRYAKPESLVIVVSSSGVVDTGQYGRPTTGIGQVRALAILAPRLTRAYRKVDLERVRMSSQALGHELESDLLILGGPKTNECAELLLDQLRPRLPLSVSGNVITWNGTTYEGVADEGHVTRDFGYIVRVPNPFAPHHRIVIVAGSHTYGGVAAARWWAENGHGRSLPRDVAVLVEAHVVSGDHVAVPRAIALAEVRESIGS